MSSLSEHWSALRTIRTELRHRAAGLRSNLGSLRPNGGAHLVARHGRRDLADGIGLVLQFEDEVRARLLPLSYTWEHALGWEWHGRRDMEDAVERMDRLFAEMGIRRWEKARGELVRQVGLKVRGLVASWRRRLEGTE